MPADRKQQLMGSQAHRTTFPVSVVMERRPIHDNQWATESWQAIGVTVGSAYQGQHENPVPLVENDSVTQILWHGLLVELFADEAESYYHNLMVPSPGCYVIVRPAADGTPQPILVTLSFDAAQAYQEGDETVHSVTLPPELYRAAEAFVIEHYVPEKRKKRKRDSWKEQTNARS